MALIICKKCGKQYSDRVSNCPQCGCETQYNISEVNTFNRNNNLSTTRENEKEQFYHEKKMDTSSHFPKILLVFVAIAIIVVAILSYYLLFDKSQDNQVPSAPEKHEASFFSISSTQKVHFSPGNLQYNPSTSSYRFAPQQYSIIGGKNSEISSYYSGWIDLFGWGTGNNPTNYSVDPWDYPFFYEWGSHYAGDGWRTPSVEEWNYLLNERNGAHSLKGLASVNNIQGLLILPDNWECPSNIVFQGGALVFGLNKYSDSEWKILESAGAVFLPAAGRRDGKKMYHVGTDGDYWSSTLYNSSRAFNIDFCNGVINAIDNSLTKQAFAVRLIKNVE